VGRKLHCNFRNYRCVKIATPVSVAEIWYRILSYWSSFQTTTWIL